MLLGLIQIQLCAGKFVYIHIAPLQRRINFNPIMGNVFIKCATNIHISDKTSSRRSASSFSMVLALNLNDLNAFIYLFILLNYQNFVF